MKLVLFVTSIMLTINCTTFTSAPLQQTMEKPDAQENPFDIQQTQPETQALSRQDMQTLLKAAVISATIDEAKKQAEEAKKQRKNIASTESKKRNEERKTALKLAIDNHNKFRELMPKNSIAARCKYWMTGTAAKNCLVMTWCPFTIPCVAPCITGYICCNYQSDPFWTCCHYSSDLLGMRNYYSEEKDIDFESEL